MKNAWDDMKKAKEEQYFKEKERELIEKEKEVIEKEKLKAHYAGHCPNCGEKLVEEDFHGVIINRCHSCKGMWLDDGELDVITHEEEAKDWLQKLWQSR